MKNLSMFSAGVPQTALEATAPRALERGKCDRCPLGGKVRSRCIAPTGKPGGLLLLGDAPSQLDDQTGKPFAGAAGRYLQELVARWWTGPILADNAVRCAPGAGGVTKDHVAECRAYLRWVLDAAKPSLVIALGGTAARAVTGAELPILSMAVGDQAAGVWLPTRNAPCYFLPHPAAAGRNERVRADFEAQLQQVLTNRRGDLRLNPGAGVAVYLVETPADAGSAIAQLGGAFAFDTETCGRMYDPEFRLLAVACAGSATPGGPATVYVWGRAALAQPGCVAPLKRLLENPGVIKVGQNISFDLHALRCGLGIEVALSHYADTQIWRLILDSEARANLATLQYFVGYGSGKDAVGELVSAASRALKAEAKETIKGNLMFSDLPASAAVRIAAGVDRPEMYAYARVPEMTLLEYCARDAFSTARLAAFLGAALEREGLSPVWNDLLADALQAVNRMEAHGALVNSAGVESLGEFLAAEMDRVGAKLRGFGLDDPGSPARVRAFLFGTLGLSAVKETESGLESTDRDSLEALRGQHPAVDDLLSYRKLEKLRSAFVDALGRHIRPDGRVHPSYRLYGAASGRMSCIARGTPVEVLRDTSAYPAGIPIEAVRPGDWAYAYDAQGALVLRRVLRAWSNGVREVVRIHWRGTGHKHVGFVDLTPDHRVRRVDGTWVAAQDLCAGDRVMALSRELGCGYARLYPTGAPAIEREHRFAYSQVHAQEIQASAAHARASKKHNHEIISVEPCGFAEVYDLEVEDAGCFIAGEICVHNCSEPNLQQIPRADTEYGRLVKDLFYAPDGWTLLQMDYSQVELRVAAGLSGDPVAREIFASGLDYHQRTAELIARAAWGIAPAAVTKKHRTAAKGVNFGILYGSSAAGIAEQIHCSVAEAEKVMKAITGRMVVLAAYAAQSIADARESGWVRTYWNGLPFRRRAMWRLCDRDQAARSGAERSCFNTVIQGSAHDYCLDALVRITRWLDDDMVPAKALVAVHDSILFEVRNDALAETAAGVRRIAESRDCGGVALRVDIETGPSWGSLVKLPR